MNNEIHYALGNIALRTGTKALERFFEDQGKDIHGFNQSLILGYSRITPEILETMYPYPAESAETGE